MTAPQILARAAFKKGKYVISFPFFCAKRRGAPVTAFTRIDDEPILIKSQIYQPDVVVNLDPYVQKEGNALSEVPENWIITINSRKYPRSSTLTGQQLRLIQLQ